MESTEKCDAVISHFNGKFLKMPAGVMGNTGLCVCVCVQPCVCASVSVGVCKLVYILRLVVH